MKEPEDDEKVLVTDGKGKGSNVLIMQS